MGILDRLKDMLGLNSSPDRGRDRTASRGGEAGVTVEREPSTATEAAVKGTDASTQADDGDSVAADQSEGADDPTSEGESEGPDSEPVTAIDGIGPAYEERLRDAGIESVGELAAADPEQVAADTDISETRLSRWIDAANSR